MDKSYLIDEPISYYVKIRGQTIGFDSNEECAAFVNVLIKNCYRFELMYEDNEMMERINNALELQREGISEIV